MAEDSAMSVEPPCGDCKGFMPSRVEAICLKMLEGKSPDASTTENSLETDVYDPIIQ